MAMSLRWIVLASVITVLIGISSPALTMQAGGQVLTREVFFDVTSSVTGYQDEIVIGPIPQTRRHLELIVQGRTTWVSEVTVPLEMQFNGDTTATYQWQLNRASGGTGNPMTPAPNSAAAGGGDEPRIVITYLAGGPLTDPDTRFRGHATVTMLNYRDSAMYRYVDMRGGVAWDVQPGQFMALTGFGYWRPAVQQPITQIRLAPEKGQLYYGTWVQLVGYD